MGKVYIIGAGPGDTSHLTIRAQQLLANADVVIYDALVDEGVLNFLPAHCERVYVGKRGGQPSITQPEINQILIDRSQQAEQVVRLKSGDPFVFGRTTSEVDALMMANCAYEVVSWNSLDRCSVELRLCGGYGSCPRRVALGCFGTNSNGSNFDGYQYFGSYSQRINRSRSIASNSDRYYQMG
jgi:Tetrapyrrole (Corrin/Porphyrin) Methylases